MTMRIEESRSIDRASTDAPGTAAAVSPWRPQLHLRIRASRVIVIAVLLLAPQLAASETAVCHVPPGHGARSITIDDQSLKAHMAHGDCLGGCPCRKTSVCSAKSVRKVHGEELIAAHMRLARIVNSTVACVGIDDGAKTECAFRRNSGTWVETAEGDFALAGTPISLNGKPGGEYIIASEVGADGAVACVAPTSRDSAGTLAGQEFAKVCTVEEMLSPFNTSGLRLMNYATREVCTSSYPHPDGAEFTRMNGVS